MTTENDLFAQAPSAGSIWAYLFAEHGEAALRETLKLVLDGTATERVCVTREEFQRDVAELTAIGLAHIAAIVREVTKTAPTEIDRTIQQSTGNKANLKARLARLRDIDLTTLKGKVDDDVLSFLSGPDELIHPSAK
jgi:hypothetical protein